MIDYHWDFSVVWNHLPLLLKGLYGSFEVTAASLLFGLIVGLLAGLMRLSTRRPIAGLARVYITIFRSVPPLVQLFWAFYALPILLQIKFTPYQAAVLTLSLQSGSFFAEIFRGGIQSIERGQWEAGQAIGMRHLTLMRRIILPQAVKRMVLPFFVRTIELFKTTTLVSTIAYADLLYQAMVLTSQTFRPLEIYTAVAALYFMVITVASIGVRHYQRRLQRSEA